MTPPSGFRQAFGQLLTALDEHSRLVRRDDLAWDAFLCMVAEQVPFYARHFGAHRPTAVGDFPVVSRAMLAADPKDFTNVQFATDTLVTATTSGTSGRALAIARDPTSAYAMHYAIFGRIWAALDLPPVAGMAGRCAVAVVNDNPTRPTLRMINPALGLASVDQFILGHGAAADRAVMASLATLRPVLLCGRPRALLHLLEAGGTACLRLGVARLFCSGDNLSPAVRETLADGFGAHVANGYASQEAGLIAMERAGQAGVLVADRGIRLELLDGEGAPSDDGEGELLVTSRANWAMPIVRYRTGDHGRLRASAAAEPGGGELTALHGRISVHFTVDGQRYNPSILNGVLERWSLHYQVVQTASGGFRVTMVPRRDTEPGAAVHRVKAAFGELLNTTAVVVDLVDRIGTIGEKSQRYVVETRDLERVT